MTITIEDFEVQSSRVDAKIAGTVFLPETSATLPVPAIIMAIGIGAVNDKEYGVAPFARRFAEEGYAGVVFDYLSWGASGGEPRNVMVVQDEFQDYRDVIAWVRTQPQRFDKARLVSWGSSFGGMHTAAIMAEDFELAAGIAQCPLVDGFAASLQIPPLSALSLGVSGIRDLLFGGKRPVYVPLFSDGSRSAPAALMAGKHVPEGWNRVFPAKYTPDQNRIAARIALTLMLHRPVTLVSKSQKPFLFVLPEWDTEASLPAAKRAAKLAPKGESLTVPGGHFDLYATGVGYDANIAKQLEFLARIFGPVGH